MDLITEYTIFKPQELAYATVAAMDTKSVAALSAYCFNQEELDIPFFVKTAKYLIAKTLKIQSSNQMIPCFDTPAPATPPPTLSISLVCYQGIAVDDNYCCTNDDCTTGIPCIFNHCEEINDAGTECCDDNDYDDTALYQSEGKKYLIGYAFQGILLMLLMRKMVTQMITDYQLHKQLLH